MPTYDPTTKAYAIDEILLLGGGWIALWLWGEKNPEPFRECSWINFRLIEVSSQSDDEGPIFPADESHAPCGTSDARRAAAFAEGFLKWDGCMELALNHHLCGRRNWRQIEEAIGGLYELARDRFGFEECE
jgi:hypothetical protein